MIGKGSGMPRALGLASAVVGLALAGCGSSTSGASSGTTQSAPSTSSAPAGSTPTATAAANTTSGSSAVSPGTKLTVGQAATVAFHPPGTSGTSKDATLKLSVQRMDKGTLSDFNGIELDATQKAATPYYVKVHLTNLGPHAINVDAASAAIEGVDTTGSTQQSVTFIGDFPRCPDKGTTTPLAVGRDFDSCLTFLVPGGITKVAYSGTDDYINSPVTWAPR